MEKWSKFFLSFLSLTLISCQAQDGQENTSNHKVADSIFNLDKKLYQGSKESQDVLKKAIQIDPFHDDALRKISVPYLKRGMPQKWKPLYEKAVQADPQTWVPMRGYLYLYFYRDYEKAIADFNASDTLTPNIDYPQGHSVDYWRGIAYLGMDDYENSIFYFDKHIKKETEDTGEDWVELEAFLYRGIAYYESNASEKALENFDKVIHYFKYSADAKYYKAKILAEEGDKKEALVLLNEAAKDYQKGFYNNYHYVELLRQIYPEDLEELKTVLMN